MANKTKLAKKAARTGTAAVLVGAAGDILGRAVLSLANEGFGAFTNAGRNGSDSQSPGRRDPAAKVLRALAEQGPLAIPGLLERTGLGLTPLLHALRDARDFGLLEWNEDDETAQLSDSGRRTLKGLRKGGGTRNATSRLLEQ